MKLLNVKRTTRKEVENKWGILLPALVPEKLFIRCNAKGEINWEKAPV